MRRFVSQLLLTVVAVSAGIYSGYLLPEDFCRFLAGTFVFGFIMVHLGDS